LFCGSLAAGASPAGEDWPAARPAAASRRSDSAIRALFIMTVRISQPGRFFKAAAGLVKGRPILI
jgi:hypothetical protein